MPQWDGKTRGGSLGYRIFIALIKHCGIGAAYALLCLVVPYFVPFAPRATAASWDYWRRTHRRGLLASCLLVIRHYFSFGQVLIDKVAAVGGLDHKFEYTFNHYERFLDVLNSGKGVIMIGAHMGNWEIGGQFFGDYGKKINIVMYDAEYQKVKDQLNQAMGGRNYHVIAVGDDDMDTIFKIKQALDDNEYVCFQGDRYMGESKTLTTTFMGREARFPAGPFLIASRLRLPVVFYFAEKESRHSYSFNFFFPGAVSRTATGPKPEQKLLEQYTSVLESRMKVHPLQWFNFYKFWNK